MDLIVFADLPKVLSLFKDLGFQVSKRDDYYSASLTTLFGRFHALMKEISNEQLKEYKVHFKGRATYIDFHWDFFLHFLFIGVDYYKKPMSYYQRFLKREFRRRDFHHIIIGGFSWKGRLNKAIFFGLRLNTK